MISRRKENVKTGLRSPGQLVSRERELKVSVLR